MSGGNFLVDTNFLIYLLKGLPFVTPYLKNDYLISEVTEMELLGVKDLPETTLKVRSELINNCYLVHFNRDIKKIAIKIKQTNTIKLPDAIIAASSIYTNTPLVTADKSFSKISGLDLQLLKLP